jgi:hypothetical protein
MNVTTKPSVNHCKFVRKNGKQCQLASLKNGYCWRHGNGIARAYRAVRTNPDIAFGGMIIGILVGIAGLFVGYLTSRPPGYLDLGYIHFNNKNLAAGDRLSVDVCVKNAGGKSVEGAYRYYTLILKPIVTGTDRDALGTQMYKDFYKEALKNQTELINQGYHGFSLGKGHGAINTLLAPQASAPPLNQDQVDAIMNGTFAIYVFIWARWQDEPQDFRFCSWQIPYTPTSKDLSAGLEQHLCPIP